MIKQKILCPLIISIIILVSFSPVATAAEYVIYHNDEVDFVNTAKAKAKERQYAYEIDMLEERLDKLQNQINNDNSVRRIVYDNDDFHDCRKKIRKYYDENDWDDLRDYLDYHNECRYYFYNDKWEGNYPSRNEYIIYRNYYSPDYDPDNLYETCKLRSQDYYNNYDYDDYLDDLHWRNKCKWFWDNHRWYTPNEFKERYNNIDTSLDPLWNKFTWEEYYSIKPWYSKKINN